MAADAAGDLELKVLSSTTGELLAAFAADASSTVAQAARRVAEASSASSWMDFRLLRGADVLRSGSTLHEALGGARGVVELTAIALPVARVEVPCTVMDACMLPTSGDVVLACQGSLRPQQPAPPVLGDDHGESSSIWLWRLSAASGWSLSAAVLLARRYGCVLEDMKPSWDLEEDQVDLWTLEQIEAGERDGVIPFPAKLKEHQMVHLHAHSEDYAIFSWNQSDYFGGRGCIDRLDLASGQVVTVARVFDVWDVTTDRDGRIFCTTCYDGTDILQIQGGTVLEPGHPEEMVCPGHHRILANTTGLGFDLCFDRALGGLVASCSRFCQPFCFFAVCPPDSSCLAAARQQPGAKVLASFRAEEDDRTPGDRASPWVCVRLPPPAGAMEGRDLHSERLQLVAHDGRVTHVGTLDPMAGRQDVHSVQLVAGAGGGAGSGAQPEVTESDRPVEALAAAPGRPLVLITRADG